MVRLRYCRSACAVPLGNGEKPLSECRGNRTETIGRISVIRRGAVGQRGEVMDAVGRGPARVQIHEHLLPDEDAGERGRLSFRQRLGDKWHAKPAVEQVGLKVATRKPADPRRELGGCVPLDDGDIDRRQRARQPFDEGGYAAWGVDRAVGQLRVALAKVGDPTGTGTAEPT
mgnify:CR=1 FL=1